MRSVNTAFRVVVIAAVFTASAVGQQSTIDLPVEPVHLAIPMTLSDAALRNDFPSFAALYADSKPSEAAAFAELHDFWKWSLTDPLGGFYGADVHASLVARYPEYEAAIADFRIVDSNGNSFYPSAETRAFLLKQAVAGTTAKVASVLPTRAVHRVSASVKMPVSAPARKGASVAVAAASPKRVSRSAGVDTSAPRSTALNTVPSVPLSTVPSQSAPARASRLTDDRFARGFALMIAGLIGLGMLTLMLRTPAEELASETDATLDPMEPVRFLKLERKQAPREDSDSRSSVA